MPVHSDRHKCPKCEKRFSCPSKLAGHSCDSSERFQCPECPLVYSNAARLQSHMPVHSDKHKCHKCECGFPNASKLARHSCEATLKRREKERKNKVLRKKDFIEVDAKTENQLFHCLECPKMFSTLQSLRSHVVLHTGEYKCPKCENGFRSPSEMASHKCEATLKKRSETPTTTGVAAAECQACGMRFGSMSAFRNH